MQFSSLLFPLSSDIPTSAWLKFFRTRFSTFFLVIPFFRKTDTNGVA